MRRFLVPIMVVLVVAALPSLAQDKPELSARAGIGTDLNLGIAVGGGLGWILRFPGWPPVEAGIDLYYYHGVDSSQEMVGPSLNTYNDTTTLMVYAVSANLLHSYAPGQRGLYYITGLGLGAVSVDWIHQSPQDTSYNDSGDYTGGGLLINLGLAYAFGSGFELRLLAPILVFRGPLDTLGFSPMLNLAASLRF